MRTVWMIACALALAGSASAQVEVPIVEPILSPALSPSLSTTTVKPYYGLTFDGGDYVAISGVPTKVAALTTGTVALWFKAAAGAQITMVALTNGGATRTDIAVQLVSLKVFLNCTIDGTVQWRWQSTNALTAGTWYHLAVAHNGTQVAVFLNGTAMAGSFPSTTDKTKWWKAVVTDATNKAALCFIGAHKLGAFTEYYTSRLTQIVFDSRVWTAENAAAAMLQPVVANADLAYYRMGPGPPATHVTDESGGGSIGTFPGGAANPTWTTRDFFLPPTRF